MDCFSWRYDNCFKATCETRVLWTTCLASSSAFSCLQLICAYSSQTAFHMENSTFGELRFMFEDISSKRSVWTNSKWSPQSFSLCSVAVRKWQCFIEVIAKHSQAVLVECGTVWEWLFDQNFKTFYVVLLPVLNLFLSQLHVFVWLFLFCFGFSWILLSFCFSRNIQDLLFYSRPFWKS